MKMNKISLKGRMMVLVGIMLLAQGLLIGVAVQKSSSLLTTLNNVTGQQMPSERILAHIDMLHDTVRSIVLGSYFSDVTNDRASLVDFQKELVKTDALFQDDFKKMEVLEISAVTKQKMKVVNGWINDYLASGKLIVDNLVVGQPKKANAEYATFTNHFKKLEKDLEIFEEEVNKDTRIVGDQGKDIVVYLVVTSSVGFVFSIFFSLFIFNWTRKSFEGILGKISNTAQLISKSTISVMRESTKVKDSAVEQSAAIQESVSALSEMSSMISQTGQNVRISIDTALTANEKSADGKKIMEHLSHAMSSIQKANTSLQDISKVIDNIVNKTTVINDIVFKTQLLSFNASIEAARAGTHGRGFAVVAEEVGNLAELSGAAAKEIEQLLVESQRRVRDTLEVIQDRVGDGYKVSQNAHQVFEEISINIEQINGQIKSIGEATQQQEVGVQQANTAMKQMDESSQSNTEAALVAQSTAEQLKKDCNTLYKVFDELMLLVNGHQLKKINSRSSNATAYSSGSLENSNHLDSSGEDDSELQGLVRNIASKQNEWGSDDLNADLNHAGGVDRSHFKKVV